MDKNITDEVPEDLIAALLQQRTELLYIYGNGPRPTPPIGDPPPLDDPEQEDEDEDLEDEGNPDEYEEE